MLYKKQKATANRVLNNTNLGRITKVISLSVAVIAQSAQGGPTDSQYFTQELQYQVDLQQVASDIPGTATAIVQRWQAAAKASGRWDKNWATNLYNTLLKIPVDNLLAADKATSYEEMLSVIEKGPQPTANSTTTPGASITSQASITPQALGDSTSDLVYTPVTPCRVVDTRVAGGIMNATETRGFDADGTDFSAQGGSATGCGVPYGVARAVMFTIQAANTTSSGYFKAWQWGASQPISGVLNWNGAGVVIANNAAVPIVPGGGIDFYIWSSAVTHAAISVVGYFAAPTATALDCTTAYSALTSVPYNSWTAVDAYCPTGRTATGGGYQVPEGTLGRPAVWVDSLPIAGGWRSWVDNQTGSNRNAQTYVVCCRVPGR